MKMLKEQYKSYEGARKRAAFENGLARGEFERGYKAKRYRYSVIAHHNAGESVDTPLVWRVQRITS